MDRHLLFIILFVGAFLFWWALHKFINVVLDKFERKHADHHRR